MQNSLNDTKDLPVEILSLFFEFCHANGEGTRLVKNGHRKILPGDRGMFCLSQICQRWRQIVLSLGALWASEIDVSPYPYLSRLVLERAGSCNLDIKLHRMDLRSSREELPLWLTFSSHPRIRSIDIRHAAYSGPDMLASLLGEDFPVLQTLVLRCRKPTSLEVVAHPDEDALLPMLPVKTLRIRHAPALTKVILRNCLLPWDADIYSRLRHLELHVARPSTELDGPESEQLPTHSQLRRVINSLVTIEELALGIFPDYDGVPEAEPINLASSCRRLMLRITARSQYTHCCRLASSLVLPPETTFVMSLICRGDPGYIVEQFAGASHPPQALSLCTVVDKNIVDIMTLPFQPGAWLESPAALLTSTPNGHMIVRFEGTAVKQNMMMALSRIEYSELKVLRITGLRDAHDAKWLLSGDEGYFDGMSSFLGFGDEVGPVLRRASKLEVLVAPLTDREVLRELESIAETDGHRSPYPLLRTMIQPPLARSDDEE